MSAPNQAGQPKEDYLDKGLDAAEKKFGGQVCLLPLEPIDQLFLATIRPSLLLYVHKEPH